MRYYTLSREDIGIAHLAAFGRLWPVSDFMGRILSGDVGKRVYLRDGVLQVENDEQRTARVDEDVRAYTPTIGPVGIDLEADAEKDRGDGGLGSGRWLGADNE